MADPLVSVIIPARNAARYLREAIDSALAQTYHPVEIICINDGSTDATGSILSGYGDRIRVIENTKPTGVSAARNRGIAIAKGEWIAFLDADDIWDSDKLAVQLKDEETGADVIHSDFRKIDVNGDVMVKSAWNGKQKKAQLFRDLLSGNRLLLSSVVVKKSALNSVGLFDTAFSHWEDYELWVRLAATGHHLCYVDRVLVSYRLHGNNASLDPELMAAGEIRVLKKIRTAFPLAFTRVEKWIYQDRLCDVRREQAQRQWANKQFVPAVFNYGVRILLRPRSVKDLVIGFRRKWAINKADKKR
jgi:glycosyltransferase involved in cell wall biosynthesis